MDVDMDDVNNNSSSRNDLRDGDDSTRYPGTRHKKTQGTLVLNSVELTYSALSNLAVPWSDVHKHQVSPVTYPKCLLKLILIPAPSSSASPSHAAAATASSSSSSSLTFELPDRSELERIRRDVTERLKQWKARQDAATASSSKKRSRESMMNDGDDAPKPTTFGDLDPAAVAVTRAELLASHPALRKQHKFLVVDTQTLTEEDFWDTHRGEIEDEYAKISGCTKPGHSSLLRSHLPINAGRVRLGVEEMRQIFLLYPAVHKAYEEKVPLELSDEQFWRKYLESEYFHRDRGRVGMLAREHGAGAGTSASGKGKAGDTASGRTQTGGAAAGPSLEEQDARAAAVGADDMFSRYDQKLREQQERAGSGGGAAGASTAGLTGLATSAAASGRPKLGRNLAVGQFDLASTLNTERGNLLEGPKDYAPPNAAGDLGSRVIQKYNRHWAMVLHPDDAVAGADWVRVAHKSVLDSAATADVEAQAGGGVTEEMERLVRFADADEDEANHAASSGLGGGDDAEYEPLSLKNVEAYYTGSLMRTTAFPVPSGTDAAEAEAEAAKRHAVFATSMAQKCQALAKSLEAASATEQHLHPRLPTSCFPPPDLGKQLLLALSKKMAQDSQTEAMSLELVQQLPSDFRKSLQSYFRRSSELLRHFFGLRKLQQEERDAARAAAAAAAEEAARQAGSSSESYGTAAVSLPSSSTASAEGNQKLARIVGGMETFYREMEGMRKALPQTETGEMMRKMCLPIMDQLDWAFQLHREGLGGGRGGGGGFVAVDES